jgi:hypothetical protein
MVSVEIVRSLVCFDKRLVLRSAELTLREVMSVSNSDDPHAAFAAFMSSDLVVNPLMQAPDVQNTTFLSYCWAKYGYRQLVCSHRYAAALMCTRVSDDVLQDLMAPWPCFAVEIPSGLLEIDTVDGGRSPLVFAFVRRGAWGTRSHQQVGWSFVAFAANGLTLWAFNQDLPQLLRMDRSAVDVALSEEITTFDERSQMLLWRLIIGLCLAMQDRSNVKESKSVRSPSQQRRFTKEPVCRTYIIGRPPAFDCRDEVRRYLAGDRNRKHGPLTVQTLVCGHWRHQPHGPGNQQRKVIWIEPFWRGPEDKPILIKPRKVDAD